MTAEPGSALDEQRLFFKCTARLQRPSGSEATQLMGLAPTGPEYSLQAGETPSVLFVLVIRSADLQEQRSGTRRTSVAQEHLDVVLRIHRIETAAPPVGDTERGARDTFVITRVAP